MDFSGIGDLGKVYEQALQRQAIAQQYPGSGGDLSLARLALQQQDIQRQQANTDRSFGLQQSETQRAQQNADRTFDFQKQQAAAAARGFTVREEERPDGTKRFVRIENATGKSTPLDTGGGGATDQPSNPFMTGGKMNESQSKDGLYANRMLESEQVLRTIDAGTATNPAEKMRGWASDKVGYNVRSPEYQKFDQARRNFINATLRRESGAVISEPEFANANQQYFPQPGDTQELLAQKRANRVEAIKGIGAGAGPGFRPSYIFDEKGDVVANPKPQAAAPQATAKPDAWKNSATITAARANPQATLAEAQKAIQGGADPAVVAQRLKAIGIDPSGLGGGQAAPMASPTAGAIY